MNRFVLCLSVLMGTIGLASTVNASVNAPLPDEGITPEVCDVRHAYDYVSTMDDEMLEEMVSKAHLQNPSDDDMEESFYVSSLRHRIDLYNAELNEAGQPVGTGNCLFGIYFLDPMEIQLVAPLEIKAIKTLLLDGIHSAGTYISGRNESGEPLPVTIDAREITADEGSCAFMIEGGLSSFQQIHDLTIKVSDAKRAICDDEGNNLMDMEIPKDPVRTCPEGTKARDCDFKDVAVVEDTTLMDQDGDGINDAMDNCPEIANANQSNIDGDEFGDICDDDIDGDGILNNEDDCELIKDNDGSGLNVDEDEDGLADACDDGHLNDTDNDGYLNDVDLCPAEITSPIPSTGGGPLGDSIVAGKILFNAKTLTLIKSQNIYPRDRLISISADRIMRRPKEFVIPASIAVKIDTIGSRQPTIALQGCSESLRQDQDMDNDGQGDACDDDVDGDTLPNASDPYPCSQDGDGDGVNDNEDECPTVAESSVAPCEPTVNEPETPEEPEPPVVDVPDDQTPNPDDNLDSKDSGGGCSLTNGSGSQVGSWVMMLFGISIMMIVRRKKEA